MKHGYVPGFLQYPAGERNENESNNSADSKTNEEGGGDAPGTRAEIPLQSLVQSMVSQAVPLQSMEVYRGADIHLQPLEDPTPEEVGARRRLGPCGKPVLKMGGLVEGPVDLWTYGERSP
ncbi:hypothetical protein BTVI_91911 [Pitangus sulphuratus]|nr:hypothetical protein BTVI_91911 [Pitangus sulphuratus]